MKKILLLFSVLIAFQSFAIELSIEDALNFGEKENLSIKEKRINAENKKRDIEINKKSFLPSLDLSITSSGEEDFDEINYSRSIGSNYTLFDGGKKKSEVLKSELNYEIALISSNDNNKNIKLEIVKEFGTAIKEKKNLKTYENQLKEKEKEYEKVIIKYENASASKSEKLSIEGSILETESNIILSQNTYLIALEKLKNLLNIKEDISLKEPKIELKKLDYKNDIKKASKNNSDIKEKENLIKISETELKSKKSEYFPNLDLNVNYSINSDDFADLLNSEELNVSLKFSYNLFDWGEKKLEVKNASSNLKINELELENSKNTMVLNLKSKYLDLLKYEKLIKAQVKKIETYNQNFKIDKVKYENKELDMKDYLESQNEYFDSKINLENLYIDYFIALYEYENVLK